jgi:hypothetical protein
MKIIIAILALAVLAGGAQAHKEEDQTPHSGIVSSHVKHFDSYTDTTSCTEGLLGTHCSGGISQDQHTNWYVTEEDGTTYEMQVVFDHADGFGFVDGDKLEYWIERIQKWGVHDSWLHVTNFKKKNGKEIKILVDIKKEEKPQGSNHPVPVK